MLLINAETLAVLRKGRGGGGGTAPGPMLLVARRGPAPKKKKIEKKIFWFSAEQRNKKERNQRVSFSNFNGKTCKQILTNPLEIGRTNF